MRRSLVALAVADVLVLALAIGGALVVDGGGGSSSGEAGTAAGASTGSSDGPLPPLPGPRTVTATQVQARPWPARVAPAGVWTASLEGAGTRITLSTVAGVVPGGLGLASLKLASTDPRGTGGASPPADNVDLTLPDGSKWYPVDPFRLDASGDLPFSSATAVSGAVTLVVPSLAAVLANAPDPVTAVGTFVAADGRSVDRLALPRATKVGRDCARPPCQAGSDVPAVSLAAAPGTVLKATTGAGSGEAAVAGTARAQALGRRWDSLVGAVEGTDLAAQATWGGRVWTLTATTRGARQLWVDAWPVADTALTGSSAINNGVHNCLLNCDLRVRWANTGWATSQIYEAEAEGPTGHTIGFDLNKSLGHDAGLGVRRG
ncbi:MAG TPA: hypothetical protein VHT97_14540, partial [Acidimicrobiales bacterium]|nr:hypothetical protein [Acidimicrobiales bacterium]